MDIKWEVIDNVALEKYAGEVSGGSLSIIDGIIDEVEFLPVGKVRDGVKTELNQVYIAISFSHYGLLTGDGKMTWGRKSSSRQCGSLL